MAVNGKENGAMENGILKMENGKWKGVAVATPFLFILANAVVLFMPKTWRRELYKGQYTRFVGGSFQQTLQINPKVNDIALKGLMSRAKL